MSLSEYEEIILDKNLAEYARPTLDYWRQDNKLCVTKETRSKQTIHCTSEVADIIHNMDCNLTIPLTGLLYKYFNQYGTDLVKTLGEKFELNEAELCLEQQHIKINGRLDMVQEFKRNLIQECKMDTYTITKSIRELCNTQLEIENLGKCHGCVVKAEKVAECGRTSFKDCQLAAEWDIYNETGNPSTVSVVLGDIENIHVKSVCKLQVIDKQFRCLQEQPMKQHEHLHPRYDVYADTVLTRHAKDSIAWHDLNILPLGLTTADWLVEIVLPEGENRHQKLLSLYKVYLKDVLQEAGNKKCTNMVVPLELKKDVPLSPSDIAGAFIEVWNTIQYPFGVIFQCHKSLSLNEVIIQAEKDFMKGYALCVRTNLNSDLLPSYSLKETSPFAVTMDATFLANLKVDVIVITVAKNLNLNLGFLSRSILKSAGYGIQQECNIEYPNGRQPGEIAVTSAGKMQHKHIIHSVLPKFHKHYVTEHIKSMVQKCLIEADIRQCRSIAFPAFGTGKLMYPARETASAMLEAIDEYKRCSLNSCLQEVIISVPDNPHDIYDIHEVFNNEYSRSQRRLLSSVGNGIADCQRMSTNIGHGIEATYLHIISEEDVKLLSTQYVVISFDLKQPGVPKFDGWFLLHMDEGKSHDQFLIKIYDEEKPIEDYIIEAIRYLCKLNTFDIVISTKGLQLVLQMFIEELVQKLQLLTNESDRCLQNIVVSVDQWLIQPLAKTLCPASRMSFSFVTSYFSKQGVWAHFKPHNPKVVFSVLGRTSDDVSEVIRKLTAFLDYEYAGFVNINSEDIDVDAIQENNVIVDDNEDTIQAGECEENVTAEINPGLADLINKSQNFDTWQAYVKQKFNLTLSYDDNRLVVSGGFDAILAFESYLEENTAQNHEDENENSDDIIDVCQELLESEFDDKGNGTGDGKGSENSDDEYHSIPESPVIQNNGLDMTFENTDVTVSEHQTGLVAESNDESIDNGTSTQVNGDNTDFDQYNDDEKNQKEDKNENKLFVNNDSVYGKLKRDSNTNIDDALDGATQNLNEFGNDKQGEIKTDLSTDVTGKNSGTFENDSYSPGEINGGKNSEIDDGFLLPDKKPNEFEHKENDGKTGGDGNQRIYVMKVNGKGLKDFESQDDVKNNYYAETNKVSKGPENYSMKFENNDDDSSQTKKEQKLYLKLSLKQPGTKPAPPTIVDIATINPIERFRLKGPREVVVSLLSGSLTQLRVDCVVNSANEYLQQTCGIAKALSQAGGVEYNKAVDDARKEYGPLSPGTCIDTRPGALPCKSVIQAVGPTATKVTNEQERFVILQKTVEQCLDMAAGNKLVSIAMPIIGCGAGGMSVSHCAIQYYRALQAFSSRERSSLKYVYLVEIDEKCIRTVAEEFKNCIRGSFNEGSQYKVNGDVVNTVQHFECTGRRVGVSVIETGEIINVSADAIVCIETKMSENGYEVANILLRKGGPAYVEDHSKLKKKMLYGKLFDCIQEVPLRNSQLPYRCVLYGVLSICSTEGVRLNTCKITQDAMVTATQNKYQSLVIPVIGTKEYDTWNGVVKALCQFAADTPLSASPEIKLVCTSKTAYQYMIQELVKSMMFIKDTTV